MSIKLLFILRYIFTFSLGGHSFLQWTSFSCFLFEFSLETAPQIFHTASNWLTLALAVQRYIYVCHPPLAKRFCTVPHARVMVSCLVGLAILHMVPRVGDRKYSIEYVGEIIILSSTILSSMSVSRVSYLLW